jgi:hypothetical protein
MAQKYTMPLVAISSATPVDPGAGLRDRRIPQKDQPPAFRCRGRRHRRVEDRHLVPARQVDLTVRREKAAEPVAIEWQRRMGMPNQANQQVLLIEGEPARRKPLRLRKRPEELVEYFLHSSRQ